VDQSRQLELLGSGLQDVEQPNAGVVSVEDDVSAELFDGLLVEVEDLLEVAEVVEEPEAGA